MVLAMPSWVAIRDLGTPSATRRRINAQSSKVITLQSCECSLFERRKCPGFERHQHYGLGAWQPSTPFHRALPSYAPRAGRACGCEDILREQLLSDQSITKSLGR